MSPLEAFHLAVDRAGSQSGFERKTGMAQQRVSYALKHGKHLPGEFVLKAEAATGVSRHALRPDLYPRNLPDGAHSAAVGQRGTDVSCDRNVVLQRGAL